MYTIREIARFCCLIAIGFIAASCGEQTASEQPGAPRDGSKTAVTEPRASQAKPAAQGRASAGSASNSTPAGAAESAPIPPVDAKYTLFCQNFVGAAHVDRANMAKSDLIKSSGKRGWYTVHQENQSSLFYGYYRALDDPALAGDRKAIESITNKVGDPLFRSLMVLPIDAPDPTAPPEWDLARVKTGPMDKDPNHYWTLQIMAFKDNPQRKQAAVEAVRDLRQGGTQAYYYHGDSVSSVCVGVWPMNALRRQDAAEAEAKSDKRVMVVPYPLPDTLLRQYKAEGITVLQPQLEIVDPSLRAAQEKFPQHWVNYEAEGVTVNGKVVPKASLIVEVPYKPSSLMGSPIAPQPPPPALDAIRPDQVPAQPGSGRLRSLGNNK